MKSSMTEKTRKKWYFFRRDVLLYDNKRLILKKRLPGRLALETSFQTKNNIWLHIVLGENGVGDTSSKTCSEKNAKQVYEIEGVRKNII